MTPKNPKMDEDERTASAAPLLVEEIEETEVEVDFLSCLSLDSDEDELESLAVDVAVVSVALLFTLTPVTEPNPEVPAAEIMDEHVDAVVPLTRVADPEKSQA